ncbi:MAG: glycosyltransferase family 4 protein [Flavobacteriaceae bacterium]|nr:glycosyltransferase family 4 protein [Flavobacteriaceae bacterium]
MSKTNKVLIITNYFPPERGAASNRIFSLAEGLKKYNKHITIVTPLPNYPKGRIFPEYRGKLRLTQEEDQMTIHRLWVFASNSKNKFIRLFAMLSYSFSLICFFTFKKTPQKVIIQSPPLIVAFISILFLKRKRRQLILNVSDLWPKAGLDLGAFKKNKTFKLLERMERFNYKNSDLILGQSHEILDHIAALLPNKKTLLYRNFPDFPVPNIQSNSANRLPLKLVYAGLLGVAQGVHKLMSQLDYDHIEFHIYGSGAESSQIKDFIKLHPQLPIHYHGEISREALHGILPQYDLTIIPLSLRIYGSVPSKIFEYARLGLPMIYFGGGEGGALIKTNKLGWSIPPGDYKALNKTLGQITKEDLDAHFRSHIQNKAIECFNFDKQLQALSVHL